MKFYKFIVIVGIVFASFFEIIELWLDRDLASMVLIGARFVLVFAFVSIWREEQETSALRIEPRSNDSSANRRGQQAVSAQPGRLAVNCTITGREV
jgi:O-antigen ligase